MRLLLKERSVGRRFLGLEAQKNNVEDGGDGGQGERPLGRRPAGSRTPHVFGDDAELVRAGGFTVEGLALEILAPYIPLGQVRCKLLGQRPIKVEDADKEEHKGDCTNERERAGYLA